MCVYASRVLFPLRRETLRSNVYRHGLGDIIFNRRKLWPTVFLVCTFYTVVIRLFNDRIYLVVFHCKYFMIIIRINKIYDRFFSSFFISNDSNNKLMKSILSIFNIFDIAVIFYGIGTFSIIIIEH